MLKSNVSYRHLEIFYIFMLIGSKNGAGLAHQSNYCHFIPACCLSVSEKQNVLTVHAFHERLSFDLKHLRPAKDVVLPRLLLQMSSSAICSFLPVTDPKLSRHLPRCPNSIFHVILILV